MSENKCLILWIQVSMSSVETERYAGERLGTEAHRATKGRSRVGCSADRATSERKDFMTWHLLCVFLSYIIHPQSPRIAHLQEV